jgi:hypothetical protein
LDLLRSAALLRRNKRPQLPAATPDALGGSDEAVIQIEGGHRHMGRGGRGHHYGWGRGVVTTMVGGIIALGDDL